jgi:hypothetical protein
MPVTAKCSLRDAVRFKEGEKTQSRGEKAHRQKTTQKPYTWRNYGISIIGINDSEDKLNDTHKVIRKFV